MRDTHAATPAMGTMGNWPQEWLNGAPALGSGDLLCSDLMHSRVTCKHLFSDQPCTSPNAGRESEYQSLNKPLLSTARLQAVADSESLVCLSCSQDSSKAFSSFISENGAIQINSNKSPHSDLSPVHIFWCSHRHIFFPVPS